MAVVKSTDKEILAKGKPSGQMASDVLEGGAPIRSFGNHRMLERLARSLDLIEGEEHCRFTRVGEGWRMDCKPERRWREGLQNSLGERRARCSRWGVNARTAHPLPAQGDLAIGAAPPEDEGKGGGGRQRRWKALPWEENDHHR